MSSQPVDSRSYLSRKVIGYARLVIVRAAPGVSEAAKQQMLHFCDTHTALSERLWREFEFNTRRTSIPLVDSHGFVSEMRSCTLRRIAEKTNGAHVDLIARLRQPKNYEAEVSRSADYKEDLHVKALKAELADNSNAFVNMSRFLIMVARLNQEAAHSNRLINPEDAAIEARKQIDTVFRQRLKARQQRSRLPGY